MLVTAILIASFLLILALSRDRVCTKDARHHVQTKAQGLIRGKPAEYKNHFLTRIFGSPYYGCYFLAVAIFSLGIFRDHLYLQALQDQPFYEPVHQPYIAYGLFATGNVLVISSMWALGVTGTYLGDYFGILMDAPVTGFPFNVTGSPMYWGSTLSFLGTSLYYGKVAGLLLTLEVFVLYWFALRWEE
jgi:methylene-fatty-acyl-phospholipid synthase